MQFNDKDLNEGHHFSRGHLISDIK